MMSGLIGSLMYAAEDHQWTEVRPISARIIIRCCVHLLILNDILRHVCWKLSNSGREGVTLLD